VCHRKPSAIAPVPVEAGGLQVHVKVRAHLGNNLLKRGRQLFPLPSHFLILQSVRGQSVSVAGERVRKDHVSTYVSNDVAVAMP
jgi:hypothetical protein